jgi:hypothetical protein
MHFAKGQINALSAGFFMRTIRQCCYAVVEQSRQPLFPAVRPRHLKIDRTGHQ